MDQAAPEPRDDGAEDGAPDAAAIARKERRHALGSLLSSAFVSTVIVTGYFVLPLSSALSADVVLILVGGLIAVALLLAWHLWSIIRSPYPRVRAVTSLATTVPVFVTVFSTTYLTMSRADPANFSEPLSRLDAAYFTMTVLATVGFGDIVPVSPVARATTTVQMVGDLILIGLIAHVIVGAMRRGIRRKEGHDSAPP